jgi:hypothetical protein
LISWEVPPGFVIRHIFGCGPALGLHPSCFVYFVMLACLIDWPSSLAIVPLLVGISSGTGFCYWC